MLECLDVSRRYHEQVELLLLGSLSSAAIVFQLIESRHPGYLG